MSFSSEVLLQRLQSLLAGIEPRRWIVAFSGGIDSTVLLHALASSATRVPIVAIHVDHGLHPRSASWAEQCASVAASLDVAFRTVRVSVAENAGAGPEAAAREARYGAMLGIVEEGDCLLSGHHEDDQAETLLLNLMRGSGPAGLAGIGDSQDFGRGRLLRPMLGIGAAAIAEYARRHALEWIDDPSNVDTRFDRNFLRQEIIPRLADRWPAVSERLRWSAGLASEASALLNELGDIDVEACGHPHRLSIATLATLSAARQRNLLRRATRRCGLPPPPATRLEQAVRELVSARDDAQPLVSWAGGELRRYRGEIFVLRPMPRPETPDRGMLLRAGESRPLGPAMGVLGLRESNDGGIDPALAAAGLAVSYRTGGETIRVGGRTRKVKKLLQEAGVLPWMRDRIPLLHSGSELVAVANLRVSDAHWSVPGFVADWRDGPEIR
jgi:tRNA(Ile)-lysidine synthase